MTIKPELLETLRKKRTRLTQHITPEKLNALHAKGIDDKHVHAISSISALALLAGSGFGLATLPLAVGRQLGERYGIGVVDTSLTLPPLPLHASYWSYPTNPVLKQVIRDAVAFAREAGRPAAQSG